jgi:hypothetical protein
MKMDIEGGALLALQVARRVLSYSKFPVSLLIEVYPEKSPPWEAQCRD